MTTSRTQFESWYQQRFGHSLYLEWNDQGFYESPATGNLFAAFGARPAVQVSSDYAELQRLAEAAPEGPWFGPEYAPGTSYVFDVDLGSLLHYESIDTEQDACLRYVAAANPAVVLALIAENERLRAVARWEGGGKVTIPFGPLCAVLDERDQLKADLDEARNGMKVQAALRLKKEIERLEAEVEALRKIAIEAREFVMHEAEVRGFLDEASQVSHRHPKRKALIESIDAAASKEAGQ